MSKFKHLTLNDRMWIQVYIEQNKSIQELAKRLMVSRQTIYNEVRRNSIDIGERNPVFPFCIHYGDCQFKWVTKYGQKKCFSSCEHYEARGCKTISKWPYVCNTCKRRKYPCMHKRYYDYAHAQEKSNKLLKNSRAKLKTNEEEFNLINEELYRCINQLKQPLYHICQTHNFSVCEKTIRTWIQKGLLRTKNVDLRTKVKRKVKKQYDYGRLIRDPSIIITRNYGCFTRFISKFPRKNIVEIDSVIGKATDLRAILTIEFVKAHFQYGILVQKGSPDCVLDYFKRLIKDIGVNKFKSVFPIILTDNGTEFSTIYKIEQDDNGEQLSRVFYCDPYNSSQKGSCESNHRLFRYIKEKGKTLDNVSQEDLNEYFSNINSMIRKSLNGKSPYEVAIRHYGKMLLNKIGIKQINPLDVNLKSK